jgi:anti-sigma factor RsiW
MHLNENDLRAYHDGELTGTPQVEASAHLAGCPDCRAELAAIAARAGQVQSILQTLAPSPTQNRGMAGKPFSTSSAAAWRIFQQRIQEKPSMSKTFARLRPLWATISLIAVLAVALSFPSVQALASNFLRMFRVQQITVLPLDMTSLKDARFDPTFGEALSQALAQQVKVTRPAGKPVEVANAAQAGEQVKFHVRVSNDPAQSISRMTVQPGVAFEGTFNSDLVQEVLQGMGKSNLTLPAGLNGAVIKANIPDAVTTTYGTCRYNTDPAATGATGGPSVGIGDKCLLLVQLPSPTVDTPPDLPVQKLAEIGLQVLGQSPEKAAQLAAQIDWTTTLVIPVPRGEMNSQTVKVDGVDGTLLSQLSSDSSMKPTYTLVWVKNGIVYGLLGSGDPARAIALGNSLQ